MDSPVALLVSSNQLLWLVGKSPSNALIHFPIYIYIYTSNYIYTLVYIYIIYIMITMIYIYIYIHTHIFGSGTQLLRCSGQAHEFAKTALLLCVVGPDELALSQLRDEETIIWCGVWTSAHEVSGQRRRPKGSKGSLTIRPYEMS